MAGVAAIRALLPEIELTIVPGDPAVLGGRPGFTHAPIGENGDPASKLSAFTAQLQAAGPDGVDIALMKFCYVDVGIETDVDAMFAAYRRAATAWRSAHPPTRFVHCTVPLCARRDTWKERLRELLGRGDVAANRRREAFNAQLRAGYGGREPVFDIAAAEATLPDGAVVAAAGARCMASCYTTDGGHLNDVGRLVVARELLRVLVGLVA